MTRTRSITAGLFLVVLVAVGAHAAQAALLDVNMGNYYYDDATPGDGKVEATVGDQLRFIAQDSGAGTPHTVEVDELNIHSGPLGTGKTFTTPPLQRAGTFKLYCKPHERKGHVASLIVYNADGSLPPPETTTTAAPATTTAPPATTAPPSPTTTSASTATTAQATNATPAATSSTTTVKGATTTSAAANAAGTAVTTPNADAPGDAASAEAEVASAPTDTVPSGTGEASEAELDAAPVKPGSLREALGRRPASKGPWTRSVRMALALLAPMLLLAGLAVSRIDRDGPPETGTPSHTET